MTTADVDADANDLYPELELYIFWQAASDCLIRGGGEFYTPRFILS